MPSPQIAIDYRTMQMARVVPFLVFMNAAVLAQSVDTGTGHKAAATALMNSNNAGAARLACPASSLYRLPTRAAVGAGELPGLPPPRCGIVGMPKEGRFLTTSIC